jgi:uncharacterized membrane protein YoaK (UPF0700 family)
MTLRLASLRSSWVLLAILSATAGAVDVIGFLALGGLFTAHITGNLVVLAAHYVTGHFGQIGPLLSVPVFIVVLGIDTVIFANQAPRDARRRLLILQAILLIGFLTLGVKLGPFKNPDSAAAVSVGMIGVAAMATQNALVKRDLPGFPSTAVMTTNITQLAIDFVLLLRGTQRLSEITQARRGARLIFPSLIGFIAGCAAGGFLEFHFGVRALVLPVVLAVIAIPLGDHLRENGG